MTAIYLCKISKSPGPTYQNHLSAAAGSIIISAPHPFIQKLFKDHVLYIDIENRTAREIFKQIDSHMGWIYLHPEEAEQMARECHRIFIAEFTLEEQLKTLMAFHTQRLNELNPNTTGVAKT